jgi:hypothetical protein
MALAQIYVLIFLSLSGFGVVFLNPESILALCFFIFFALILRYGDGARQSLDSSRDGVREELVRGLLESQGHDAQLSLTRLHQKAQLLDGLKVL